MKNTTRILRQLRLVCLGIEVGFQLLSTISNRGRFMNLIWKSIPNSGNIKSKAVTKLFDTCTFNSARVVNKCTEITVVMCLFSQSWGPHFAIIYKSQKHGLSFAYDDLDWSAWWYMLRHISLFIQEEVENLSFCKSMNTLGLWSCLSVSLCHRPLWHF